MKDVSVGSLSVTLSSSGAFLSRLFLSVELEVQTT